MKARQLWFTGPKSVQLRTIELPEPKAGEHLVETELCGISAGTENLLWNGVFPRELMLDESIPSLRRPASYPCPYGYDLVGRLPGRDGLILAFHPHADKAMVPDDNWFPLPGSWSADLGVLLPNTETAVNLVLDLAPSLSDQIVVFGLGVVGLISLSILSDFPLKRLIGVDPLQSRRERARNIPGVILLHPEELSSDPVFGIADRVLEISGHPAALQQAVRTGGYDCRIVVGSWFGEKEVQLNLGLDFHRRRQSIVSSQVSTLAPSLRGRWSQSRRMEAAVNWLDSHGDIRWITHRFPLETASEAYTLLNSDKDRFQVVLVP